MSRPLRGVELCSTFIPTVLAMLVASTLAGCHGGGSGGSTPADDAPSLGVDSSRELALTAGHTSNDQNPCWSPDDDVLLFSSTRNGSGNLNLWLMDADGSAPGALTSGSSDSVNMPAGAWNEATDRIAFSSDRSGFDEVWTMAADGSDPVQVTRKIGGVCWEPSFSPDGQWIVFQTDRDGNQEIYKVRADGQDLTRLTSNDAADTQPVFSPDGQRIVFQTDRDGNQEVYVMEASGTDPVNVTDDPAEDTDPSWFGDGTRLLFSSDRSGDEAIWVIEADGSGTPWQITPGKGYEGAPSLSHDRLRVAFERQVDGQIDLFSKVLVDNWLYQLQGTGDLSKTGESHYQLAVIDYSADGEESGAYRRSQIEALADSPGGRKIVLAYLSIGEAEDYRYYWDPSWKPGNPAWLGPENPDWPGNYKVRYWLDGWQQILFKGPDSYLEKILDQGFDGVYLDIIDAYEYWGPDGVDEKSNARGEMIDLVAAIASQSRSIRPGFIVIPQNAPELTRDEGYLATINGVAIEDVFYDGDTRQDTTLTDEATRNMDRVAAAGKLVLVVDYCRQAAHIDDFYDKARSRGYVPYATVRDLDRLIINDGHEPYPTR